MTCTRTLTLAVATVACLAAAGAARAGTLENLERERAIMVETILDPSLTAVERQGKIALSQNRLVDLERMVIRDKSLAGKNTPVVKKAFENYDLTFLVHASVEKNLSLMDHWLSQVGVSTKNVMDARVGRRW
ncbi:MAG: hypothetical protein CMF63_03560 [Magnetovibrio sp.]|nr:hypothetical protein [Magnetovibrio sp.]